MDPNLVLKIYVDPRRHKRLGWEQCEGFSCKISEVDIMSEPEATGSNNTPLPLVRFDSAMQIEPTANSQMDMECRLQVLEQEMEEQRQRLQAMEQEMEEQKRGYEARIAAEKLQTHWIMQRARASAKRSRRKTRTSEKRIAEIAEALRESQHALVHSNQRVTALVEKSAQRQIKTHRKISSHRAFRFIFPQRSRTQHDASESDSIVAD
jgi:hypothetical protein